MHSNGIVAAATSAPAVAGGPVILLALAIVGFVIYLVVTRRRG